jgi:hypothetical protein
MSEQCHALLKDKTRQCSLAAVTLDGLCYVHSGLAHQAARESRAADKRAEARLVSEGRTTRKEHTADLERRERRLKGAIRTIQRGLRSPHVQRQLAKAKLAPTFLDALNVLALAHVEIIYALPEPLE